MLEVEDLQVVFGRRKGHVAVDGVSLRVDAGSVVGLVGESGSGKSTLARSVVGLSPVTRGKIVVGGREVHFSDQRVPNVFPGEVQMVFQDPYASLNPRMDIASIIREAVLIGDRAGNPPSSHWSSWEQLLEIVGISRDSFGKFPHQFSGGQLQRVSIGRALAIRPRLLLLDEVTASLDVSVQATVLNLLKDLQSELGISMLYISHDLSVVRYLVEHVYVMRRGKIVEAGASDDVFTEPSHEYTRQLVSAVPRLGGRRWRRSS